jgi:hypothetical protein
MEQEAYRHVPYDIEVEQALLGAILVDNRALERVGGVLKPEHFYDPLHSRIFEIMSRSIDRGGMVLTPLTLNAAMKNDPGLIEVGGHAYLAGLAEAAPALPNVRDYAQILTDLTVRRGLIHIGEDIVNTAYEAPHENPPKAQIEAAEKALYAISESSKYGEGPIDFAESLRRTIDGAVKAQQRGGRISGIATGFTEIDSLLGGLQPSDLIIVAGRPGMGKSSLAVNMAFNTAKYFVEDTLAGGAVLLPRNGGAAALRPYPLGADRDRDVEDPQRQVLRQRVGEVRPHHAGPLEPAALLRRYRRYLHRADRGARQAHEAREEHRLRDDRPSATRLAGRAQREPRAGTDGDHQEPEGARQGTGRAGDRALATEPRRRCARRQAAGALRSS